MILALIALHVIAAGVALVASPRVGRGLNLSAAVASAALAGLLAADVLSTGVPQTMLAGYLRADGLAAAVALTVALAGAIGAFCGARELVGTGARSVRTYTTLSPLLVAALLVAALSDNLGVKWISIELAAVLGAFLIGAGGGRVEHEAAMKYMLLGSAGLVLALLATVVVHGAGVPVLGHGDAALSFARLQESATGFAPQTMKIALVLAAAGYGLKVGLFPLHVWKPDAYAAAPAAVAAVLAGGAVLVPLEALIRFGILAGGAGEGAFAGSLFTFAGVLSMIAALVLMANERDLRRILAYTSVEQLGLILLACGEGTMAARGALVHMVGNGVLKALAFGVVGFVVLERGTADTHSGPGLYRHSLGFAAVFLLVIAASLGFPPFALFTSEVTIVRALFAQEQYVVGVLVLLALAAIFGVVVTAALRVVFSRVEEAGPPPPRRQGRAAIEISVPALLAVGWLGIALPTWLWDRLGVIAQEISP